MKVTLKIILVLLPLVGAELVSRWWMNPKQREAHEPVLEFSPPHDQGWQFDDDEFRKVRPALQCSRGLIADIAEKDRPDVRVAWFAWDNTSTGNTMEAFKHMPDQCMGGIGMKLEKAYDARRFVSSGNTLVFDSTLFRPLGGGVSVHVFKCVWVEGLESPDLRNGIVWGSSGTQLRRLRLSSAATRFKPRHTRVVMGAVVGVPSEQLAWHRFSTAVLGNLKWQEAPSK
ncbi:hypothetical protein OKA04_21390 [Luteolibacter flavescens]|uniref:Exosortase-associated EpsI family protein n=1 Tax=Luteolibacter flavescens TaxID=1859460 RepID=A0ABT3FUP0_9BACT|nr:hypothetical protein [Luteolibacter flavescens]MCW1887306.1 hypothetical protein [Luteolibacter flavescens]